MSSTQWVLRNHLASLEWSFLSGSAEGRGAFLLSVQMGFYLESQTPLRIWTPSQENAHEWPSLPAGWEAPGCP